ncbi:MAG: hypothetical protein MI920_18075 [Kiloniellales bacterium]|nr:hypothetical protein [Kiloniellales bacterium]
MNRFITAKDTKAREQAEKQARADRLRNKLSFAEAVRTGQVPAGANPYYVQEYQRVDGEITAQTAYHAYLTQAWQNSDLHSRPFQDEFEAAQAFSDFADQARSEFLKTAGSDSVDWLEGFDRRRAGVETAVSSANIQQRLKVNEARFEAATGLLINETLAAEGLSTEERIDRIQALFKDRSGQFGMSGTKFNELVADQIVAASLQAANDGNIQAALDVIELADQITAGTGKLSGLPKIKDQLEEAELRITRIQQQREELERSRIRWGWSIDDREWSLKARRWQTEDREYTLGERQRAESERDDRRARDMAFSDAAMEIIKDPEADHTDMLADMAAQPNLAPLVSSLQALQSQRISLDEHVEENPEEIGALKVAIAQGQAGPGDIALLIEAQRISTPRAMELINDWVKADRFERTMNNVQADVERIIRDGTAQGRRSIAGSDEFGSPATATIAAQAQADYEMLMLEWLVANPQASRLEAMRQRSEILEMIINDPQYSTDDAEARALEGTGRPPFRTPEEARAERARAAQGNIFDGMALEEQE